MRKYFCDKCSKEMSYDPNDDKPVLSGTIDLPQKGRREIYVKAELYTNETICRNCLLDAIAALDYRPKVNDLKTFHIESGFDTVEDDDPTLIGIDKAAGMDRTIETLHHPDSLKKTKRK